MIQKALTVFLTEIFYPQLEYFQPCSDYRAEVPYLNGDLCLCVCLTAREEPDFPHSLTSLWWHRCWFIRHISYPIIFYFLSTDVFIKQYSDPRYILTVNPSLPSAVSLKYFLSVLSGEQWRWEGFCCDWSQFSLLKPAPRGPLGLQPRLHSLCSKENDRNENNYFRKTGINNGGKPLLANRHICNPFKILNLS